MKSTKDCGMMMVSKFQKKINTVECSRLEVDKIGKVPPHVVFPETPRLEDTGRHQGSGTHGPEEYGVSLLQKFSSFGAASPKLWHALAIFAIFYHGQIDDIRDDFIMEHHGTLPCFNHLQPEVQTLPIGRPVSWHQAPVAIRHVKGVCSKGKHCLQRFAGNDFHWQNHANAHQMHIFNN